MRRIYTCGGRAATRNLTVADLLANKAAGIKMTQVSALNGAEAAACEAAGIDLITIADVDIAEVRAAAQTTFVTGSQTMVQYVTEDEAFGAAPVLAHARKIKCPEEILAMNLALAAAEDGMTRMRAALRNGIAEQALWALIWQALIEHGGEWLDYRLLASGERTHPWQQEASSRTIRAGDLVVFDCGMVGPFSYGADVSRAFHCGPGRPSDAQKKLYTLAWSEVMHNTQLLRAGTTFRDFIAGRYVQEPGFDDQPYPCAAHGVGMADEWPVILHSPDHEDHYDGRFEAGMVICVESYVGEIGGIEGVKLEDQVLITESGPIALSRYPFEETLLSHET